ncbi:MAG: response regulator [Verrucomicrobia bacterium]|jgi:two-component system, OmpR family, alkaline phosphatase synthesis response regulator PhoP|nr:response regulator [Verrucomicrobiota bacterium]
MAQKVLVVDDEADIVELLSYNLQLDGFEVIGAASGLDALNQARTHLPEIIILDLMLPDMDGFSVCEILRCQPSTADIPVIVLTAMAGEFPRLHGFEVGATDYCTKPIRPRDLRDRVKALLENRAAKVAGSESAHAV